MSNIAAISVSDDFDLKKIMESGQAFRITLSKDGFYRFVTGSHILYIKPERISKTGCGEYSIECINGSSNKKTDPKREWEEIWIPYFDLKRDYSGIRKKVPAKDKYMLQACENGAGLRILKQEPWEMIITFITSQRKSIPAIKGSLERICEKYGKSVDTGREKLYLFPSAKDMKDATPEELADCKLGYRVPYILDAVNSVLCKDLDLSELYKMPYEEVFEKLKSIHGIGDKVSNCICLFAYAKTEAAPVDTWISKVIEQKYTGVNPFPYYGDVAGIMQQYIFYYALTHKDSL